MSGSGSSAIVFDYNIDNKESNEMFIFYFGYIYT
jgi:hypothetical protein